MSRVVLPFENDFVDEFCILRFSPTQIPLMPKGEAKQASQVQAVMQISPETESVGVYNVAS